MKHHLLYGLATLLLLFIGTQSGKAATTDVKYVLSASTYVNSPTDGDWRFQNGLSIVNGNSKKYATGKEDGIKFSRNEHFAIQLPSGLSVSAITFKGYDNYGDADAYIKELNGTAYGETDYVFPMKTGEDPDNLTYTVVSHTIDFATPVTDEITFTAGGQQVVWVITLVGKLESSDEGGDEGTPASFTIAENTYVDSTSIGQWNFQGGIGMVNEKGKAFSKGMEKTVKYSKGVQFTITLPEKFNAKSIVIKGYGNEDANDAYLAELNGTNYEATDYVFPHRIDSKHATLVAHEVPFAAPVSGNITITPQGAQAAWIITVNGFMEDDGEQPQGVEATYAICASNFVDTLTTGVWNFKDGITVVNEKDKKYQAGLEDGVKFSAGVQHTIKLPANFLVQSVTFKGYDNYPEVDAYIKELNGSTFGETDYVFPMKTGDDPDNLTYTMVKHTINLDTPASEQLTFTTAGKQVVCAITLKGIIQENSPYPGDANEDGTVDVADVMSIVNYMLNIPNVKFNYDNANINGDELIDVADAMIVVGIILKQSYQPEQ